MFIRLQTIDVIKRKDFEMLVTTRKEQERIKVGNDIVITIVRIMGDKVRIGIEAPQDVRILRTELEEK